MSLDKRLGVLLCAASLLIALTTGLYFLLSGEPLPLAVFVWPAAGFMIGLALIFFDFMETALGIDDELQQFPELVADDVEDFRRRRLSLPLLFLACTLVAIAVEAGVLIWYRKELASWGPVNVLVVALVAVLVTLFISLRKKWFQERHYHLRPAAFLIPTAGWMLCLLIGMRFAEPIEFGGLSPMARAQIARSPTYWASTRSATYFLLDTADIAGQAALNFDCDGEGCLLLLLVAVVVASIAASAVIPHFWVVATTLLLTFMLIIAIRELLVNERAY